MTADDQLGERGRAIFDRLRADVGAAKTGETADDARDVPPPPPPPPPTTEDEASAIADEDGATGTALAATVEAQLPAGGPAASSPERPTGSDPENQVLEDVGSDRSTFHVEQERAGDAAAPSWPATSIPDVIAAAAPSVLSDEAGPLTPVPGSETPKESPGAVPAATRPTRPPPPDLPRVMAIANQKGGVGKTTTAVNLGAALAEMNYRVLIIDLDPQGNATTGLGINPRNLEASIYDVLLRDTPLEDCIEPTSVRNLFVCPATIDLAGAEIELVPAFSRELKLRRAIEQVIDEFDFFLIDCPPSLGLITVNGLAAATEVLVPIQCEYYALEGLGQLLRNVSLVQTNLNPRLEMTTIILTMYDARTKLSDQVAAEVRNHFGTRVCRNIVPRTVRLSEAPSFGQPIIVFDPTSRGAIAYRELAKEVSGGAPQRVR